MRYLEPMPQAWDHLPTLIGGENRSDDYEAYEASKEA